MNVIYNLSYATSFIHIQLYTSVIHFQDINILYSEKIIRITLKSFSLKKQTIYYMRERDSVYKIYDLNF